MKKSENAFGYDETRADGLNYDGIYSKTEDDRNDVGSAKSIKQESNTGKRIIASGIGVMAGMAGAFGYNALRAAPAMDESIVAGELGGSENSNIVSNPNMEEPASLDEIQFATTPDDEMSFNEAFAAARKEVGPNGVFEWRGGVFGTYYNEEWDNMSDEYKEEFGNHNWKEDIDNLDESRVESEGDADSEEKEMDITKFEIQNDEDGNEYIVLKDAISGDELHVAPDEFGLAVTDDHGEVIAFLTNDYLAEHPEPNGVIQFDGDGNCIVLDTMDYVDSGDVAGEFVPEPLDDDVEVLDVVVPEEFDSDYAVIDDNGEVVGGEVSMQDSVEDVCQEDICTDDISQIDDDGMIMDDCLI